MENKSGDIGDITESFVTNELRGSKISTYQKLIAQERGSHIEEIKQTFVIPEENQVLLEWNNINLFVPVKKPINWDQR